MAFSSDTRIREYSLFRKRASSRLIPPTTQVFLPTMKGFDFERALVELIADISAGKGMKAKPLAEKAWPHRKDAGTKWRKIRNSDPPQELSVRDAYDLACAMGVSITDLCGAIQSKALETSFECPKPAPSEKKDASAEIPPGRPAQAITETDAANIN